MPHSKRHHAYRFRVLASLLLTIVACQGCDTQQPGQVGVLEMGDSPYNAFHRTSVAHSPMRNLPPSPVDPRLMFDGTHLMISLSEEELEYIAEFQPQPETPLEAALSGSPDVEPLTPPAKAFDVAEFDEAARRAANTSLEEVLAFFPAESQLSDQYRPRVQQAFTLARSGALHAAKDEFHRLLSELARAKDASQMTSRHDLALKAGLRAIEEADDFLTAGEQQGSPVKVAAGHQTPMLHAATSDWVLPHEAIAMYHLYAQQKLAAAVQGEQAGSMLLFGLGKTYSHIAERDQQEQAKRKSLTMYRSAVGAHGENYLAANEAGVLLAQAGRYAKAAQLLDLAARLGGSSATHRNLAFVHAKLGDTHLASQHRTMAEQIAQIEMQRGQLSAEHGVTWVSPDQFSRTNQQAAPRTSVANRPAPPQTRPTTNAPPPEQPSRPSFWW